MKDLLKSSDFVCFQGSNRGIREDLFSFLFPLLLILVDCLDHCCVKMSPTTKDGIFYL